MQAGQFQQAIEQTQTALTIQRELAQPLRTTDNLATLAATYLALGDPAEALNYAHQTLAILVEDNSKGQLLWASRRNYFICYQVLTAAGQIEAAQRALQAAYELVMSRAAQITYPTLHQSFLEQKINREILREYEREQ